ncbi:MAG TPA: phospholipid carrier-dependent glycosyltransferase [Stellaceae bacterium]|nr:phospholipid carrier-dependent glycosyltransferase [Stellaceae bacterium]
MIERWSVGWRPYALLALLCLGLYLPGLAALPVIDRDEARFAQASRQMLESGDFLRIRFQDEARNKKPVGVYWLQSAAVAALSTADSAAIWPYRLPSLLGALAAALLTFALGRALVGGAAALLGAALLASALGTVAEAHLAKTDALLLAAAVAAQTALGAIYRDGRRGGVASRRWALLFWAAQGMAILIKGPVVPLLSLLAAGSLALADRDARWLRGLHPLWGVPVMLAIAAPWLVAITAATGGAFLGEAVGHDFLGKLIGAQEAHGAWPGSYLLLLFLAFWPGSLLLAPAASWAWEQRAATPERFLIAWAVPFWLVLELVPTKLPNYLLPAYPALALLAARASLALAEGRLMRRRWLERAGVVLFLLASLLLAAALVLVPERFGHGLDLAGIAAAAIILFFGTRLALASLRRAGPGLAVRAALLALLVLPAGFALVAPGLDGLWLSREAARMVARYHPPPAAPVVAVGYAEPSLVFLLGTATRSLSPEDAAQYVTSARGAAALVSSGDDTAFRQALARRGWQARPVERTAGLDYSNGKALMLTLYTGVPG